MNHYRSDEESLVDMKVYKLLQLIYRERYANGLDSAEDLPLIPPEIDDDQ
jgi:hypothetical protein